MSGTNSDCWINSASFYRWANETTANIDEMNLLARTIKKDDSCVQRALSGVWNTITSPSLIVVGPLVGYFCAKQEQSVVGKTLCGLLVGVVSVVARPILEVLNPIPSAELF